VESSEGGPAKREFHRAGRAQGFEHGAWSIEKDPGHRGQRTDDRWFRVLNIEEQNKKPQNDEVITSIFEIPCSTFCGSKKR
jgi:hypothetical protein